MLKLCSCCDRPRVIVNSYFQMCQECNTARLNGNKKEKDTEPLFSKKVSKKGLFEAERVVSKSKGLFESESTKESKSREMILRDELFYEDCFNNSDHKCEECNAPLPDVFRDDNGKVVARWRYSHIIPKSIAPELRHDLRNINHLCMKHHHQWDFGDRKSMNIFEENSLKFPHFF